ncbi:MAG: peptidylprolyl isomerase [Acholeplasmataceae bacterium]|nr:peptidylprolyl isomerase [Acholeplasmataceae bacterium]
MKKIVTLMLLVLGMSLTGCANMSEENKEQKEEIDMTKLPYVAHLNEDNPVITIKVKDFGVMEAQLFPSVAKLTVDNFISYIEENAFNNSGFHRIIETFMIQGGIVKKTKSPIKGEFLSNGVENNLRHFRGVLSMARTIVKDSATSQFFIMHETSPHLDGQYASFGGLISGFNVLDKIATVETDRNDAPLSPVIIESITVNLNGYKK